MQSLPGATSCPTVPAFEGRGQGRSTLGGIHATGEGHPVRTNTASSPPRAGALRQGVESVMHERSPEPPVRGSRSWKHPADQDEFDEDDHAANEVDTRADGQNR